MEGVYWRCVKVKKFTTWPDKKRIRLWQIGLSTIQLNAQIGAVGCESAFSKDWLCRGECYMPSRVQSRNRNHKPRPDRHMTNSPKTPDLTMTRALGYRRPAPEAIIKVDQNLTVH